VTHLVMTPQQVAAEQQLLQLDPATLVSVAQHVRANMAAIEARANRPDVSAAEANQVRGAKQLADWAVAECLGLAEHITKTRIAASTALVGPDGQPVAGGVR
jgi:hypothetical protein